MKTTQITRLTLLVAVLATLASPMRAAEETKTFNRSSTSARGAAVDNRYGNIAVKHSNKNEVAIIATVRAKASSQERALEMLKTVTVEFSESGGVLKAETRRGNYNGRNNESLTTDVEVTLPGSYPLTLENKYGSISFPSTPQQGKTTLEVAYGAINGGNFEGEVILEVQYSNIAIDKISHGVAELSYCGQSSIGEITHLSAELRYSKLASNSIKQIVCELSYSELKAKEANEITLEGKYSKLDLGTLAKSLSVDGFGYSKLSVDGVGPSVSHITIKGLDYGSAAMNLSALAKLSLNLGNERFSNYSVSDELKAKSSDGGGTKVQISGNYSNVKLR